MDKRFIYLVNLLLKERSLSVSEYAELISFYSAENAEYLAQIAVSEREKVYGRKVFIRGLIEISNYCKNDCLYCGIRRGNSLCRRFRLSPDEIFSCCEKGYALGFRTFVMQGGEDGFYTDDVLVPLIKKIKERFPDCAVTLSLGERGRESFARLRDAGADRYLLRHETADCEHYARLHPSDMSFENRMKSLCMLSQLGYQVGAGFMVGSPYQTTESLAKDLKFIEQFRPDMCGIGPFIPHRDTPFADFPAGSGALTCYLLSVIRVISPHVLLPATTALASLSGDGRAKGILSGANVVMPNLSPKETREKYALYNGKASTGIESAEGILKLSEQMKNIGYEISVSRGDVIK